MKESSTGQLVKIISCDVVGDKTFINNFCGEVKVDDVLFNVIKKDGYGEDIKSATLLLRKAQQQIPLRGPLGIKEKKIKFSPWSLTVVFLYFLWGVSYAI